MTYLDKTNFFESILKNSKKSIKEASNNRMSNYLKDLENGLIHGDYHSFQFFKLENMTMDEKPAADVAYYVKDFPCTIVIHIVMYKDGNDWVDEDELFYIYCKGTGAPQENLDWFAAMDFLEKEGIADEDDLVELRGDAFTRVDEARKKNLLTKLNFQS